LKISTRAFLFGLLALALVPVVGQLFVIAGVWLELPWMLWPGILGAGAALSLAFERPGAAGMLAWARRVVARVEGRP
jgi:hypothetical protein